MNKAVRWLYKHKKFTATLGKVLALALILFTTIRITAHNTASNLYATTAVITEVNHTDDYIVAINHSRTFIIYPSDDWHVGDYLSILMHTNNTVTIIDDEIIDYHYTDLERTEDGIWTVHTTHP